MKIDQLIREATYLHFRINCITSIWIDKMHVEMWSESLDYAQQHPEVRDRKILIQPNAKFDFR